MNKSFRIKITGGTVGFGEQGSTTVVSSNENRIIEFPEPIIHVDSRSLFISNENDMQLSRATASNPSSLNLTDEATFEFWAKITFPKKHTIIDRDTGGGNNRMYKISYINDGAGDAAAGIFTFYVYEYRSSGLPPVEKSTAFMLSDLGVTLNDGYWHHLAFRVFTSGSFLIQDLLVDGLHHAVSSPISISSAPFNMGNYDVNFNVGVTNDENNSLYGSIDELRIWNTKIDHSQIIENMDKKLTGQEDNLIGYWNFDVSSWQNNTFKDLTNRGADLSLVGSNISASIDVPF